MGIVYTPAERAHARHLRERGVAMPFTNANPVAVLVATIAVFILGYIWYVPLFGAKWRALTGRTEAEGREPRVLALLFLATLVVAFVLGEFASYAGASTLTGGALIGLLAWFGFYAATSFADALAERSAPALYFIDNGYYLTSFVIMGAIIGAVR